MILKIRRNKLLGTGLLSFLLLVALSCSDILNTDEYEIKKLQATPSYDLPLAFGDLSINDLLSEEESANIKVDADGLVYLLYEQTLKSQDIRDLLQFPNKSLNKTVPVPGGVIPASASEQNYASISTTEDFSFNPEKLTEIKFKGTILNVSVNLTPANSNFNFEVQVKLANFKNNGVALDRRISLGTTAIPLADYVATLNDNKFPLEIAVIVKPHNNPITVLPSNVTVSLSFSAIDFQYVKGFFGDQAAINIPAESIDVSLFGSTLNNATVSFAQPKLSFNVSNDYGIPTKVTFNPLEARKKNGLKLPLVITPSSPVSINVPASLGQSAITDVTVNNTKQLIDFAPDQFYYKVSARINEGLTTGINFCADTSKIRVSMKAEIPLYGKASNIVLADTVSIDLSDVKDSNIESGAIKANINNQLPLDAFIQLYLTDDKLVIFDSLFTIAQTAIVKASSVNATGELAAPGLTTNLEIPVPKEKLNKLFDAKNLIIKARLNTTRNANGTQPDVKFKSNYIMKVNFGLRATFKLEADL